MNKVEKEYLDKLVQSSTTWSDVVRGLGLRIHGANYRTVQRKVIQFNIDTSHFTHYKKPQPKLTLKEILVKKGPYKGGTANLKKRLINAGLLEEKCYESNCPTHQMPNWNGKGFNLQLDHIDGDRTNNLIENLRLLCPICHTHTETFVGRNKKRKRKKYEDHFCIDCRKKISFWGKRCRKCASNFKRATKISWPSSEKLKRMVEESSFLAVGRKLGVTDNSVRKRLKSHPPK